MVYPSRQGNADVRILRVWQYLHVTWSSRFDVCCAIEELISPLKAMIMFLCIRNNSSRVVSCFEHYCIDLNLSSCRRSLAHELRPLTQRTGASVCLHHLLS